MDAKNPMVSPRIFINEKSLFLLTERKNSLNEVSMVKLVSNIYHHKECQKLQSPINQIGMT